MNYAKKPENKTEKFSCYDEYLKDGIERGVAEPQERVVLPWMTKRSISKCKLITKGNFKVSY